MEPTYIILVDPKDVPDGFTVKLGGLDPFSHPEGSTNTVLEHVFYSGVADGAFLLPKPSVGMTVLRISASGSGSGRLVVGDSVVPLVAPPPLRGGAATNTLLLALERGVRKTVWMDKPDGLDVGIGSDDLLVGRLPSAMRPRGWIAFPYTDATVPCIHDFASCTRVVSLLHADEFPGLTAEWSCDDQDVSIENRPPASAEIRGGFKSDQTKYISYTVDHPDRLNRNPVTITQELKFCPRFKDGDGPAPGGGGGGEHEHGEDVCQCPSGGGCSCCRDGLCGCTSPNCLCGMSVVLALDDGDDEEAERAYTNIVGGASTTTEMSDVLRLYGDDRRTIHLQVPSGEPRHCCDCPEHCQSNYVAGISSSSSVVVKDSSGKDFDISYESCDVTVIGVSPSRGFADSMVVFVTNGVERYRHRFTVLGVRFESEAGHASLDEYNRLSRSLGYPVPVSTNAERAGSIAIRTDVRLPDGVVRLSLKNVKGDISLCLPGWTDDSGVCHAAEPILRSGTASARHFTLREWRGLMRRYGGTERLSLKVLSPTESSCDVALEFVAANGLAYVRDSAEQRVSTVMPLLLPDYNRDFSADARDALDQGNARELYFWTNNDTWSGDDAFSRYSDGVHLMPTTFQNNGGDLVVNGRNDLVNLCPFTVRLSSFVREWGDGARYELRVSNPENVHFVPVRTEWNKLDRIVKEDLKTVFDEDLHSATLLTVSGEGGREHGYVLPPELVGLGDSEAGVIAVEFTEDSGYLLRVVAVDSSSGASLFESAVSVNAMDVHRMYRWLNLDYACGWDAGQKYHSRLTADWPDGEHADANVVFVHGYNMHQSEAWDWSQAVFKRLWWSGADAGFTAVLWRGNESQVWVPKVPFVTDDNGYATRNYHQNVLNAFRTASEFASRVNELPGERKYMIAHSLGNMLVSAARQDYGLRYDKYFMLNAAVPVEAYDAQGGVTEKSVHDMTPTAWRPYSSRLRSTHWHELPWRLQTSGAADDARKGLTWKGRFRDVDNTINFYSSKDEVVANGNDEVDELLSRKYAWYNQEMNKGFNIVSFNPQAGWDFSGHYWKTILDGWQTGVPQDGYRVYTPEEAELIADTNLMARPFFKDFRDERVYGEGGSDFVRNNELFRWYALSHGIPAESFAAGANPVPKWGASNIDMAKISVAENNGKEDGGGVDDSDAGSDGGAGNAGSANEPDLTPEGEVAEESVNWVHSYFIRQSLFDTKVLYETMAKIMGIKK